jgi:hypothetical protein
MLPKDVERDTNLNLGPDPDDLLPETENPLAPPRQKTAPHQMQHHLRGTILISFSYSYLWIKARRP